MAIFGPFQDHFRQISFDADSPVCENRLDNQIISTNNIFINKIFRRIDFLSDKEKLFVSRKIFEENCKTRSKDAQKQKKNFEFHQTTRLTD